MPSRDIRQFLTTYLANNPTHAIASEAWRPCALTKAKPLGTGGSSQVFRVLKNARLKRAMKILNPRPSLQTNLTNSVFVENFETEAEILSVVTHQNITKLLDYGFISVRNNPIPYIVTDYVDGVSLIEHARSGPIDQATIMNILDQVLICSAPSGSCRRRCAPP